METRTIRQTTVVLPCQEADDLEPCDAPPPNGTAISGRAVKADSWTRAILTSVTIARTRFTNADLSSARFDGVSWDRCSLRGCTLVGAHLEGGTLKNVIFENCRLDYATLSKIRATGPVAFLGCSMTETMINRCQFSGAVFDACKLTDTEFDSTDLRGADLRGNDLSNLVGVQSLRQTILSPGQLAGLTEATVRELALTLKS